MSWPTDDEDRFCSFCDSLSADNRKTVLELIKAVSNPKIVNLDRSDLSPIEIVYRTTMCRVQNNVGAKQELQKIGILDLNAGYVRKDYAAMRLSILPYVSKQLDISLHWILNLDDQHIVLAKSGETETIMDYFCLLPPSRKTSIYEAVRNVVLKGGLLP